VFLPQLKFLLVARPFDTLADNLIPSAWKAGVQPTHVNPFNEREASVIIERKKKKERKEERKKERRIFAYREFVYARQSAD